jgi:hypothetical protein
LGGNEASMNWDAIGAIGEVLGSIAVFITLGYLALQVRHARSEASRALSQGRMEANREVLKLDIEEQHLVARIKAEAAFEASPPPVVTLLMERANLALDEAWRIFLVEVARWNYRIHVIAHYETLPSSEQLIFDAAVRHRMASDLSRWMYEIHFKEDLSPDVERYLERLLG